MPRFHGRIASSTYIATDEGWLYLAVVIDLFSRQVVGWSLREDMTSNIVIDALRMAWFKRHPGNHAGVLFDLAPEKRILCRKNLLGLGLEHWDEPDSTKQRAAHVAVARCLLVSMPQLQHCKISLRPTHDLQTHGQSGRPEAGRHGQHRHPCQ